MFIIKLVIFIIINDMFPSNNFPAKLILVTEEWFPNTAKSASVESLQKNRF